MVAGAGTLLHTVTGGLKPMGSLVSLTVEVLILFVKDGTWTQSRFFLFDVTQVTSVGSQG